METDGAESIENPPGQQVDPPDGPYSWSYILDVARHHRRQLILVNLIGLLAATASVPIPLTLPLLVDEVILNQPGAVVAAIDAVTPAAWHSPLLYVGVVMLLTIFLRLASMGCSVWQAKYFTDISKDLVFRIRSAMLQRLERVSMAEYETLGSGMVASHFITDLETIDGFIGSTAGRLLIAVLSIIGIAAVLIWLHWQLALFILLLNPLVIWMTMVMGKHVKELKTRQNAAFATFQDALTETLESIHQIRASNRERHYVMRMVDHAREVKERGIAYAWRSDAANRASGVVFAVGVDVFRAVTIGMVIFSTLSIGQMFAVFGYLWFMMGPVQDILNIQYSWYSANAALKRINSLFDTQLEPEYPHLANPFHGKSTVGIRVQDLHFAYGDGPGVLNGVNLEIAPGEKVALVGASGGGKSTLVSVLIGLYAAKSGSVCYDGEPVTRIGLDVVRENVATVLQHPALFNDTVRNNLTLGRPLPDAALWRAIDVAQLRETVGEFPAGLDTIVGRDGVRLSGGQRQRMAIARMILTDPKVVILDEATSALDAETEYRLHQGLAEFLSGRTTIIVAHRLSAIKQAQQVYVFENGQISEQGNHAELLRQDGLYSKLYGLRQSAG